MTTFDSTKTALPQILDEIISGKIQLPDFQRGWVWDDEHVRSLLVSIARSFPVGAVMLLETGGEARFQTRPVENVEFAGSTPAPEKLILDGQQRLTTLTQVLKLEKPVKTFNEKKHEIDRYYYFDIIKAQNSESMEDAVFAVPADRKLKTDFDRVITLDLSTAERECAEFCFPCNQILNSDRWEEALQEYNPERFKQYMEFRRVVLGAFRSYQLPIIALNRSTSKEAVCLVFEKVNTGGVPLSVFELVTATFAADNFNLRDDWLGSILRNVEGRSQRLWRENNLTSIEPTDFLQTVSLLKTYATRLADLSSGKTGKIASPVSAKRGAILNLALDDYRRWADEAEAGYRRAAQFLRKQFVLLTRDLPYRTQLPPLAAVLTHLGNRWLEPKIYDKLSRWFWCGVFGELYGGAVETRIANDFEELLAWIGGGIEPRTVIEANFQPQRLKTLRTRVSAAYKGLNVLVQREGSRDFFWKASIRDLDEEDVGLDIHHIFPRKWCEDRDVPVADYDCIINKTPISYKANRMIGGEAPSRYLRSLQNHAQVGLDQPAMDALVASHRIAPATLRSDDFRDFFQRRGEALCAMIADAIGKPVDATGYQFLPERATTR